MKAVLEFNLPDDQYDHMCAVRGVELNHVLGDLDQKLRSRLKYESGPITTAFLEEMRADIHEVLVQG